MHDRDRIAKEKPLGPYSPPTPSEVDQEGPEPMAVANDKQTIHGESFVATTSSKDVYDKDVAAKYGRNLVTKAHSNDESVAAEKPDGYAPPDKRGWARPTHDE